MVDPNQAHRELARDTTFMGLRRPDHRHRRGRPEGRQDTVLSVVLGTGVGIGQPQDMS